MLNYIGHETTSTAVTAIVYALSCHQDVQDKLRAELLNCEGDQPTMENLGELPYLDAVLRETLRMYTPVPVMTRSAEKDDVIPTSQVWEDVRGIQQSGVR